MWVALKWIEKVTFGPHIRPRKFQPVKWCSSGPERSRYLTNRGNHWPQQLYAVQTGGEHWGQWLAAVSRDWWTPIIGGEHWKQRPHHRADFKGELRFFFYFLSLPISRAFFWKIMDNPFNYTAVHIIEVADWPEDKHFCGSASLIQLWQFWSIFKQILMNSNASYWPSEG